MDNTESILLSLRRLLVGDELNEAFDMEIIIHANSAFATLHQLGVGPDEVFNITGPNETWDQFLEDKKELNAVKSYLYLKVRLLFDPPTGSLLSVMQEEIKEAEWRLNTAVEFEVEKEG